MAGLTFSACGGMSGGFGIALTDAVVTTGIIAAQVHYLRIAVIECSDDPIGDIVTFATIQRRWQMCGALASGNHAIMATGASP